MIAFVTNVKGQALDEFIHEGNQVFGLALANHCGKKTRLCVYWRNHNWFFYEGNEAKCDMYVKEMYDWSKRSIVFKLSKLHVGTKMIWNTRRWYVITLPFLNMWWM